MKTLGERALFDGVVLVAVVETHLSEQILDAEVKMEGYQIFRADRLQGRKKGGVAIFVRDEQATKAVVLSASSDGVVEHLILWFDHMRLGVVVVYRPPSYEMENFGPAISHISSKLEEL